MKIAYILFSFSLIVSGYALIGGWAAVAAAFLGLTISILANMIHDCISKRTAQRIKLGDNTQVNLLELSAATRKRLLKRSTEFEDELKTLSVELESPIKKLDLSESLLDRKIQKKQSYEQLLNSVEISRPILILGEAGTGKSKLMKRIAFDLAFKESGTEEGFPVTKVPLLLNCASWNNKFDTLEEWVIRQLKKEDCDREPTEAVLWLLDNGKIILLLDGIDEIDEKYCSNFVDCYSRFMDTSFSSIVLSSRPLVFESSFSQIEIKNTYILSALKDEQIRSIIFNKTKYHVFFNNFYDIRYDSIRAVLRTPLMLDMLIKTSLNLKIDSLLHEDRNTIKQNILMRYVRLSLRRKPGDRASSLADELRWLKNLATGMQEPEFRIEDLQHSWLKIEDGSSFFDRVKVELFAFFVLAVPMLLSVFMILIMVEVNPTPGYNFVTTFYILILFVCFLTSRKTLRDTKSNKGAIRSLIPDKIQLLERPRFKVPDFLKVFSHAYHSFFYDGKLKLVYLLAFFTLIIKYSAELPWTISFLYASLGVACIFFIELCAGLFRDAINPDKIQRNKMVMVTAEFSLGTDTTLKTIAVYCNRIVTPLSVLISSATILLLIISFSDPEKIKIFSLNFLGSYLVLFLIVWFMIFESLRTKMGATDLYYHYFLRCCLHLKGTIPSLRMKEFCDDMVSRGILRRVPGGWRFYHQEIQAALKGVPLE